MKKTIIIVLLCLMVSAIGPSVFAAENPGEKFARGIVNIITSPIEIAKQIDTEWKAKEGNQATVGIFSGLMKGLAYTIARMGSGAWDVISCPFNFPKNYDPLLKPEFVLDK